MRIKNYELRRMKNKKPEQSGFNEILLYTTPNGGVKVEIYLQNETVWLTQQKIAELFGVQRPAVTKHLKNIFESGELKEDSVSSILEHTAADGKKYSTQFYNLNIKEKFRTKWHYHLPKVNLRNTASFRTN